MRDFARIVAADHLSPERSAMLYTGLCCPGNAADEPASGCQGIQAVAGGR
jgi:hypothetical protein